ncbi:MAG: carbamate kinase [Methylobacteriaceae bacterium]|jgi:carbamate kinase|nr:carbamate kinase [Methylobacteriaceae bacterium]
MMRKLAVVAVGGNALVPDSAHLSIAGQYDKVCELAGHLAAMMSDGWTLVLTHGNGPQVGMILRRSELSRAEVPPVPMDYAGADIQGAVGYMFCKALRNECARLGLRREIVALVTQTVVSAGDPAFANPTKPIGSWFSREQAEELAERYGWSVAEDSGRGWRRVVASPRPVGIIEETAVRAMLDAGMTVVCLGGGGIPVIVEGGEIRGVEAVIDKDMSSSLLAIKLKADMLILPTAVERLAVRFGKPDERRLDRLSIAEAGLLLAGGEFPEGSMAPKVRALIDYVRATSGTGVITSPARMREAVAGRAGTRIER